MIFRIPTFLILIVGAAFSQRPPVILVDGYHLICENANLTSGKDFGDLQARLQAEGIAVYYFGTCSFRDRPSVEDLGNALGTTIRNLNIPQVDLVTHSMGGLVVRAYLSGKQRARGVFNPPFDTRVRKWVSIATPNFGALLPTAVSDFLPDVETQELVPGNQFLFDLATWNQNHDDLRGVDTVAIIGNAAGFGPFKGASDGTVAVTSASMSFARPDERTRVLPYCHGAGDLTSILGLGCDAPPLAKMQSDNPLSWRIIDSFLSSSDEWRTIGHSPTQDNYLSRYGGVLIDKRDNLDRSIGSVVDRNFVADAPLLGTYSALIDKPGPTIDLIAPSAARMSTLSLAPRMLISIYGSNLANSSVSVNGQSLLLNYIGDHQVNALLPDSLGGIAALTVSNDRGKATTNIYVEAAVPAVFTMGGSGTGPAAAIRTGDYVSVYLTGLGIAGLLPVVTLNGTPATVTYSGPAPGFAGLDQINFQLPPGVASGVLLIRVGDRESNAVTLPPG